MEVFKKDFTELPIYIDLHRLIRHITLVECEGIEGIEDIDSNEKLFNKGAKLTKYTIDNIDDLSTKIGNFLIQLCDFFEDSKDLKELVEKEMINQKISTNEIPEVLSVIFSKIGKKSKVMDVLRCINQGIVAPCVTHVRINFVHENNLLPMSRISWTIRILLHSKDKITVSHVNHEKSSDNCIMPFDFCWYLNLDLESKDDQFNLIKVNHHLFSYNLDKITSEDNKNKSLNQIKELFPDLN